MLDRDPRLHRAGGKRITATGAKVAMESRINHKGREGRRAEE
jgi:hypothetical protein